MKHVLPIFLIFIASSLHAQGPEVSIDNKGTEIDLPATLLTWDCHAEPNNSDDNTDIEYFAIVKMPLFGDVPVSLVGGPTHNFTGENRTFTDVMIDSALVPDYDAVGEKKIKARVKVAGDTVWSDVLTWNL